MLRFLIFVSLSLLIVFTGIGVLLSRQWGWSEYASDELYVVYYETANSGIQFFLVNSVSNSQEEKLSWKDETLKSLRCSPDGRTLAFLTDQGELRVITETQIVRDTFVDEPEIASVANNGTVAFDSGTGLFPPQVSSSGISLMPDFSDSINVISSDGRLVVNLPNQSLPKWLASEQIFIFYSILRDPVPVNPVDHRFLMDISTHQIAEIPMTEGIISPDGMERAFDQSNETLKEIFIADVFSDSNMRQLTHDSASPTSPLCFLTFRPQVLIADSQ